VTRISSISPARSSSSAPCRTSAQICAIGAAGSDRASGRPLRTKDPARLTLAIGFPTEAKLLHVIKGLNQLAKKHGVRLR
jgi:hypothetical protein